MQRDEFDAMLNDRFLAHLGPSLRARPTIANAVLLTVGVPGVRTATGRIRFFDLRAYTVASPHY
jgi:hypothetical protein